MKRKIRYDRIFGILAALILLWVFVSFIDTNLHNDAFSDAYGQYAEWNAFNLLCGLF